MKAFQLLPIVGSCLILCGCGTQTAESSAPTSNPEQFLKWSMNQYAGFKTYQASVDWEMKSEGEQGATEKRQLSIATPNKFKVITTMTNGMTLGAVSDGSGMVEYANGQGARKCEVPKGIAAVSSMQMKHPMFNGSLLYQFFGGSDNFNGLVAVENRKVEFGSDEKAPGGEDAKTVKFYAPDGYGNVEALIGTKTGLVYRIKADEDGLKKQMGQEGAAAKLSLTENFLAIKTNEAFPDKTFDTTPPKGSDAKPAASMEAPPPVPLGKPAPDIEVTGLGGKKVKLSSLKGKVVMIDFWATWCPPCRKGLPITNKMHSKYASQGLQVLAVSNEELATVSKFIKENKYTFPTYLDPGSAASKVYHVTGIPCLVIVDAQGNLSSYSMGLEPEEAVLASLKKAGLKT